MEEWKKIEGYEWLYEVSSLWKIRSFNFWKEEIIKSRKERCYSRIDLYKNKIRSTYSIHRLVAIHFIPNPINLPLVCHKDETLDEKGLLYNWMDNLFWWTTKDNYHDMVNKWRASNNFITNNPSPSKWNFWKDHQCSKVVYQYALDWSLIKEWGSVTDAKNELLINNISPCCRWKQKTAWWFKWSYTNITQ